MNYRIGIDTGGTHTDIVLLDEDTSMITAFKVPTTTSDLSIGIMHGIQRVLAISGVQTSRVERFVYGTTLVTNMIVQEQEINVGLITTKGFRDVLDIGKAARRWNIYDIYADKPRALIPRQLRFGVSERINAHGEIIQELDEKEVNHIIDELKRQKAGSIAVCLLHSYQNPRHEERIGEMIQESYPDAFVSLSSQIIPEFREYERTSTTAINALVTPSMVAHLDQLEKQLCKVGVGKPPYLMQSNGGVASFATIKEHPVNAIHSGPIAGVVGAIMVAKLAGFKDVITMDMGGTSCDVSLVENYEPKMTTNSTVAGHSVRIPTIDIHTIGAGGGSIAWIDPGGGLKVGPRSAGAVPGPACYNLGGTEPTVTDANFVVGRIGQASFLGGEVPLNAELARSALDHRIAAPLGLDLYRAANGILEIANANMIKALKLVSVARGYDPRDFALVAFGGAGPMHGTRIAEELRCKTVIIPFAPGVIAALGLLAAPIRYDYVVSRIAELNQLDLLECNGYYKRLAERAYKEMSKEGIANESMVLLNSADLRYRGQAYEVNIPVPNVLDNAEDLANLVARFNGEHSRRYGYCSEGGSVEIVNMRVTVIGNLTMPRMVAYPQTHSEDPGTALLEERNVYFHGSMIRTAVYLAGRLQPGHVIKGPAIIQDTGSTTVLFPGQTAGVDPYRNLIVRLEF
jgi:N-methylhydantoinase A